ncbi:MAG: hypothetical protein HYV60_09205, partial [Planctomycetia bacterium]|nr:hypothetical protein [Planctomycetia bacterium]
MAARLRQEIAKGDEPLADWMKIELLYLDMRLQQDFARTEEACWAFLGAEPKRWNAADARPYDMVLFQRYLATAANLAVRRSAKPESVQRLIDYIDRGIAREDASFSWKMAKYQLLVALDRPAELERELRNWIRTDEFVRPWQVSLANLLAEQGKLDDAIALYETVERSDELVTSECQNLANWYLVKGLRGDYERTLAQAFSTMEEHGIRSWLGGRTRRSRGGQNGSAIEITPEVLVAYRTMFRKSERPDNHLSELASLYGQTRDVRLLQVLADAVIGQSAGKVYPLLGRVRAVLDQIEEEAAVDAIVERIATVRRDAETPVDERALDLLQALAERRAATLLNQPQAHVEAALAAMRCSFDHEWSDGERRLAAEFLAGLGKIDVTALADEQQRQLRALFRKEKAGTLDRLHISQRWAETLWAYNHRDVAVRLLELSIREFENSLDGGWPRHANFPVARYVEYLGVLGRFIDAETLLQRHSENSANDEQRVWIEHQLNRTYEDAIRRGGQVSRGQGQELYEWLERRIREQIAVADDKHQPMLVDQLCSVYRTAKRKVEGVDGDLHRFAFEPFNAILHKQMNNPESLIDTIARTIQEVRGEWEQLDFLLYQIEHEPGRLKLRDWGIWQRHAYQISTCRTRIRDLGELEPRLLKIVLGELERCLRTRAATHGTMYHKSNQFWREKEDAFRQLAERVYVEQKGSGGAVQHIADYLYGGLGHHDRAIEMLLAAHESGLLTESGQSVLVRYLHEQKRWQESIAILRPLVRQHRENITFTVLRMLAYSHVDRERRVESLLTAADQFFRRDGRWTEANMEKLASISMECQLFPQAIGYYKEIIPLHERTQPNRGIGNGALSAYYMSLSQA